MPVSHNLHNTKGLTPGPDLQATSNVDTQTDSLIQDTVRSAFGHCTVLTIAHRLHTILACDRILVLDAGNVAEFGPPQQLLQVQL